LRKLTIPLLPIAALLVGAIFIAALASLPQQREAQAQPLPVGDIVFMIDESGSMEEDQADVMANVNNIANQLGASVNFQLGLIGFGAFEGHDGTTNSGEAHVHTALTSNVGAFSTALGELVASGGFEPGFEATVLGMSKAMGFRAGAGVCGILITDEDADDYGDHAQEKADALAALNSRNAAFIAVVDPEDETTPDDYGPNAGSLAAETGGQVFDILDFRQDAQPVLTAIIDTCIAVIQERAATPTPTTRRWMLTANAVASGQRCTSLDFHGTPSP